MEEWWAAMKEIPRKQQKNQKGRGSLHVSQLFFLLLSWLWLHGGAHLDFFLVFFLCSLVLDVHIHTRVENFYLFPFHVSIMWFPWCVNVCVSVVSFRLYPYMGLRGVWYTRFRRLGASSHIHCWAFGLRIIRSLSSVQSLLIQEKYREDSSQSQSALYTLG